MASLAAYYDALVEDREYESADFALGDLPARTVEQRFACAEGGREFAANYEAGEPSLVTIGVTMTGPPHLGTLGQLVTAVQFQEAGFDVQLIFADLIAYNAAGRNLVDVRALTRQYLAFARELGFDPDEGTLRNQEDADEVLHTAQLLSRYFDPGGAESDGDDEASTDDGGSVDESGRLPFEEELAAAYDEVETQGAETTRFAGEQASLLLPADTLSPVLKQGYENVLFVGGADNHGLAASVREVLDPSPWEAHVAGLYSKLVGGFDGYPKMCKSIPASRVTLDADPDVLRDRIRDPCDDYETPEESLAFQMMRVASEYGPDELDGIRQQCARRGAAWADTKGTYAEYVASLATLWDEVDTGSQIEEHSE